MLTTLESSHLLDAVAAGEGLATGMNLSVVCAEFAPLTSQAKIDAANEAVQPEIAAVFSADRYMISCPLWGVPAVPESERAPVSSDIPTLILAGAFDPSTPPAWGEHIARTLSHGQYRVFQAATHGVINTPCGFMTMASFLHDPNAKVEPACAAQDTSALWSAAQGAQP